MDYIKNGLCLLWIYIFCYSSYNAKRKVQDRYICTYSIYTIVSHILYINYNILCWHDLQMNVHFVHLKIEILICYKKMAQYYSRVELLFESLEYDIYLWKTVRSNDHHAWIGNSPFDATNFLVPFEFFHYLRNHL